MIRTKAVEKAESMKGKIDPKFSIGCNQFMEVQAHYGNSFETGLAFFRLGYMQGMKAAQAEARKKVIEKHR